MSVYFGGVLVLQDLSNLEDLLYKQWSDVVPLAYSRDLTAHQRESHQKHLIDSLEQFLTQASNPTNELEKLRASDDPPLYCGRAFRNGEPTYSCRDCAVDPTCVMCMRCFQQSIHKSHKYRINTSSGGGYCDCGDVDAWKEGPSCTQHGKETSTSTQDPEARLPEGVRQRAEVLMELILRHCYNILIRTEYRKLPSHLSSSSPDIRSNDLYCVMLLNDEIHTYDQVIQRLEKAVGCTHKEAVEFATSVDREGRTCVYSGPLSTCQKYSNDIQRKFSSHDKKILEAVIMHHTVVAQQQFAHNLLKWLETLLECSDGLRRVFCRVAMKSHADRSDSLVEKILLSDTVFWKATRQQFHQLFMTGVFKDLENKTIFAILFTKNYTSIYREFVRDDHYRIASATAITVQIYTVTTIVKVLIEKHRLMEVIMQAILNESKNWKEESGTLNFQRRREHEEYTIFKRVQFALHDLKYALSSALPSLQWNADLRKAFLEGLQKFLELSAQIQGMDGVKRFTAQHIEFEPEWETAFNLQLKSLDCVTLLLRWCSCDEEVLFNAYRIILGKLIAHKDISATQVTVAGHKLHCCMFEVGGTQSYTSIHLPLHRFLAGLNNHLPDGVTFLSHHFLPYNQQLELADLLELPLRVQVLMAQVQADMWKRNGYAILNQIYYYQYVKCRQEMYDRDIQLIQNVAALMDPNHFIIHVLHKFNISPLFQHDEPTSLSHSVKQLITLVDEALHLLIIVLGERYVEGVGQVTRNAIIQREIVHLLAINRMSHSDLDKNLPEDSNYETNLEENVREVAEFHRTGTGKGMYSLKDECRQLFNPFFYHYSKTDQSKAEGYQRMMCVNKGLSEALPIPMTPRWEPRYAGVSRLFTCDVMLCVIHALLSNMVGKRSKLKAESHFERVLHLITLALHEDKRLYEEGDKSLKFVAACRQYVGPFDVSSERMVETRHSILDLLNQCSQSTHITHKPLQGLLQHVLTYYNSVANMACETAAAAAASHSHPSSSVDDSAQQAMEREKARRAAKAAKSRQKILDRMAKLQKKFIEDSADLFQECSTEAESQMKGASSLMDISSLDEDPECSVALGVQQTPAKSHRENFVCILCQEASTINDDTTVVYAALIQRSTVMARGPAHTPLTRPSTMALFVPADLKTGLYTTTCGHPMHESCWKSYYENAVNKEQNRLQRAFNLRQTLFDIDKGEFYCPLCESLANAVLPVLPNVSHYQDTQPTPQSVSDVTLSDWLQVLTQLANPVAASGTLDEHCPFPDMVRHAADSMMTNVMGLYDYLSSLNESTMSEDMLATIVKYLLSTYSAYKGTKMSSPEVLEDPELPPVVWNTTAYTIQVLEHLIRSDGKPLFGHLTRRQEMCISLMVRFASVCRKALSQAVVGQHCKTLLQGLLLPRHTDTGQFKQVLDIMSHNCIIDIDVWHYLVSLCFAMPSLFVNRSQLIPAGSVNEQYLLHMLLSVHMAQIMLGPTPSTQQTAGGLGEPPYTSEPSTSGAQQSLDGSVTKMEVEEESGLLTVYKRVYTAAGLPNHSHLPTAHSLHTHLITASLPFLRCAALFFSNLTDVPPPPALHALCEPEEEYTVIANYLAIPTSPSDLFTEQVMQIIVSKCADPRVVRKASQGHLPVMAVEYPLKVNGLVDLPHDFGELINSASLFMCPNSMGSDESRTPTLCLICGKMLCSQSYCCQVEVPKANNPNLTTTIGAASAHAASCGSGSCMFLRVRQCQVLLLAGRNKGCFLPAPYVDDYGESDVQLKRGNPLHLCKTTYRNLHRLWLSHGIQERVARSALANAGNLIAEWFHL